MTHRRLSRPDGRGPNGVRPPIDALQCSDRRERFGEVASVVREEVDDVVVGAARAADGSPAQASNRAGRSGDRPSAEASPVDRLAAALGVQDARRQRGRSGVESPPARLPWSNASNTSSPARRCRGRGERCRDPRADRRHVVRSVSSAAYDTGARRRSPARAAPADRQGRAARPTTCVSRSRTASVMSCACVSQ